MGLYSGGLIIGRIFASEIVGGGALFSGGLIYLFVFFFLGGGAYYRSFTVLCCISFAVVFGLLIVYVCMALVF